MVYGSSVLFSRTSDKTFFSSFGMMLLSSTTAEEISRSTRFQLYTNRELVSLAVVLNPQMVIPYRRACNKLNPAERRWGSLAKVGSRAHWQIYDWCTCVSRLVYAGENRSLTSRPNLLPIGCFARLSGQTSLLPAMLFFCSKVAIDSSGACLSGELSHLGIDIFEASPR